MNKSKQKTGKSKSRGRMYVHYFGLQGSRPKVTNGAFKKGKSTKSLSLIHISEPTRPY